MIGRRERIDGWYPSQEDCTVAVYRGQQERFIGFVGPVYLNAEDVLPPHLPPFKNMSKDGNSTSQRDRKNRPGGRAQWYQAEAGVAVTRRFAIDMPEESSFIA